MLEFATVRGAQNAALSHKIGTLTPGKEVDIVIVRAGDVNTMPLTNAVATVVCYAHAGNVDTVFIAGVARKWAGKLVDVDLIGFRERVQLAGWIVPTPGNKGGCPRMIVSGEIALKGTAMPAARGTSLCRKLCRRPSVLRMTPPGNVARAGGRSGGAEQPGWFAFQSNTEARELERMQTPVRHFFGSR
jgi:hypothetical protein